MKNLFFKELKKIRNIIITFLIFGEPLSLLAQQNNMIFNIVDTAIIYKLKKSNTQKIRVKFCILNDSNNYRLYEFSPIINVTFGNPKNGDLNKIAGIYYCLFDSSRNFIGDIFSNGALFGAYLNKKKNMILFKDEKESIFRTESPSLDIFYEKELSIDLYPYFGCYQRLKKGKYYIKIFYNFRQIPLGKRFNNIRLKCKEENIKIYFGNLESDYVKLIIK